MRLAFAIIAVLITTATAEAQNCKKGKPCGNTCIARSKTCHVGEGTARWSPGFSDTVSAKANVSTKASGGALKTGVVPAEAAFACTVSKITDGDTLRCEGYKESVRLLLIDSPEMGQGEYGRLAKDYLEALTPIGTVLKLEIDVVPKDRYGRMLAYGWMSDGRMINEEMTRGGFAVVSIYQPNVRHVDRIRAASDEAKLAKRGLWSGSAFDCTPADYRAKRC